MRRLPVGSVDYEWARLYYYYPGETFWAKFHIYSFKSKLVLIEWFVPSLILRSTSLSRAFKARFFGGTIDTGISDRHLFTTTFWVFICARWIISNDMRFVIFFFLNSDPKLGPFLFLLLKAPVGNRRMLQLISNLRPISQSHLKKWMTYRKLGSSLYNSRYKFLNTKSHNKYKIYSRFYKNCNLCSTWQCRNFHNVSFWSIKQCVMLKFGSNIFEENKYCLFQAVW